MSIKHNLEQWVAQLDYDDTCDISDRQVSELIRGYSALEAKCAALAAELKQSQIDAGCYKHGMEASNARLVQVAAENAGLKSFGGKLAEMHNDLNGEGTGIQGRAEVACQQVALEAAMEEFDAIKTPATDAFMAEVRAQGGAKALEDFAEFNIKSIDPFDDEYTAVLKETARAARGFADQLRQDANTAELVAAGIITKVGE